MRSLCLFFLGGPLPSPFSFTLRLHEIHFAGRTELFVPATALTSVIVMSSRGLDRSVDMVVW